MNINKTEVLIVGAGPVGMSLALLLKRANIDFTIIDKRYMATQLPRAIAINQGSLSLFDEFGILDALWHTSAKFGHKISNFINRGNIVLAGDALHQFSPIGGTNMNFGLQDVVILSKALSAMIKTENKSALITEYVDIRTPKIKQQVDITKKLTKLLTVNNINVISDYKDIYKMLKSNRIADFLSGI